MHLPLLSSYIPILLKATLGSVRCSSSTYFELHCIDEKKPCLQNCGVKNECNLTSIYLNRKTTVLRSNQPLKLQYQYLSICKTLKLWFDYEQSSAFSFGTSIDNQIFCVPYCIQIEIKHSILYYHNPYPH